MKTSVCLSLRGCGTIILKPGHPPSIFELRDSMGGLLFGVNLGPGVRWVKAELIKRKQRNPGAYARWVFWIHAGEASGWVELYELAIPLSLPLPHEEPSAYVEMSVQTIQRTEKPT
jgi:hypothetical protein